MSQAIQQEVNNYKSKLKVFCDKYLLSIKIYDYMVEAGLDLSKTRITTNTRSILATLFRLHDNTPRKKEFKKDVMVTFQLADTTFYNLKRVSVVVNYDKLNLNDFSRSTRECITHPN